MSSNLKNVKSSVSNIFTATTGTAAVAAQLAADSTGFVSSSIGATPAVLKALLCTPFAAAKGYLIEAEGLSEEEAEAVAYKYLRQDVAKTIEEAGTGSGKLVALLLSDAADDADKADKKEA